MAENEEKYDEETEEVMFDVEDDIEGMEEPMAVDPEEYVLRIASMFKQPGVDATKFGMEFVDYPEAPGFVQTIWNVKDGDTAQQKQRTKLAKKRFMDAFGITKGMTKDEILGREHNCLIGRRKAKDQAYGDADGNENYIKRYL